ncbi:MAG: GldG family protein [bacterium]
MAGRRVLANSLVSLAALLGVLVFVYLFAARHPLRADFTREGRFRLTPETAKVLDALTADIAVFAFYREGDESRIAMKDLLDEYAAHGKRVRFQFVDPDRNPGLAKEYSVKSYGTTVVQCGERRTALFNASEAQITSAILRVTREGMRTLGIVTGHGERAIGNAEKEGLSELRDALERSRVDVREVFLMRDAIDHESHAALLLAGPAKDLLPEEHAVLERYVGAGGGLVALVDPGAYPELADLLEHEGIGLGDDIIVDRLSQVFGADNLVPVVSSYPASVITKQFGLATFYPIARSVALLNDAPPGAQGEVIVMAGPGSWGERDTERLLEERKASEDAATDRTGPLAIAVVRERPAGTTRARLVVFGDSDFASNAHFLRSGNGDLLQNAISWAMGDEDPSTIRPRDFPAEPLVLTRAQGRLLFWLPVVGFPAIVALAGAFLVMRRR